MGLPADLRQVTVTAAGEPIAARGHDVRQPAVRAARPAARRGALRAARARRSSATSCFPSAPTSSSRRSSRPTSVRILIWERGVGPTTSSGTGSCAALIAAAAFGGAARDAEVIAPGGPQRVEWRDDSVYLTGWAEVVFDGGWLRGLPTLRSDVPLSADPTPMAPSIRAHWSRTARCGDRSVFARRALAARAAVSRSRAGAKAWGAARGRRAE